MTSKKIAFDVRNAFDLPPRFSAPEFHCLAPLGRAGASLIGCQIHVADPEPGDHVICRLGPALPAGEDPHELFALVPESCELKTRRALTGSSRRLRTVLLVSVARRAMPPCGAKTKDGSMIWGRVWNDYCNQFLVTTLCSLPGRIKTCIIHENMDRTCE